MKLLFAPWLKKEIKIFTLDQAGSFFISFLLNCREASCAAEGTLLKGKDAKVLSGVQEHFPSEAWLNGNLLRTHLERRCQLQEIQLEKFVTLESLKVLLSAGFFIQDERTIFESGSCQDLPRKLVHLSAFVIRYGLVRKKYNLIWAAKFLGLPTPLLDLVMEPYDHELINCVLLTMHLRADQKYEGIHCLRENWKAWQNPQLFGPWSSDEEYEADMKRFPNLLLNKKPRTWNFPVKNN